MDEALKGKSWWKIILSQKGMWYVGMNLKNITVGPVSNSLFDRQMYAVCIVCTDVRHSPNNLRLLESGTHNYVESECGGLFD